MRLFQNFGFETAALDLREKVGSGPFFLEPGFETGSDSSEFLLIGPVLKFDWF
ncbi:MAG: hypothetical protein LBG08_07020 [Spirochaetaceae bacterium]|jgi:hypothetical protein|nr:hypothetical protein [Spirochaetaceae bacterium]